VPRREKFVFEFFTTSDPNWVGEMGNALYAAQATGVVNLELAPARFLFQKV
jgi:hypothetical protein